MYAVLNYYNGIQEYRQNINNKNLSITKRNKIIKEYQLKKLDKVYERDIVVANINDSNLGLSEEKEYQIIKISGLTDIMIKNDIDRLVICSVRCFKSLYE